MKNGYVIWLDDERPISNTIREKFKDTHQFVICKTFNQARLWLSEIEAFESGVEIIVCFDHDLGGVKTGYDLAKWIVENEVKLTSYEIHTMNPVGRRNIVQLLDRYGYRRISNGIFA